MQTSDRTLVVEAAAASLVVLVVSAVASPHDLGVPALGVHPAWLPVTLFAARYGVRGLCVALSVTVAPLVVAGAFAGHPIDTLLERVHNPSDVLALLTAVAAAWIGLAHESRVRRVSHGLEVCQDDRNRAEATVDELAGCVEVLRARCDRMDSSLTLWRSIANRLEHGSPEEAASAALELCALRCGATAGAVQSFGDEDAPSVVACQGTWSVRTPRPADLSGDRTVRAATAEGGLVSATDIEDSLESDADVAIPILDELDSRLLGVIALRGVDPIELRAAEMRDLTLVAEWLAAPIARFARRPRLRAVNEEAPQCQSEPT